MLYSTQQVILEMFREPISWLGMEKLNLTQQKCAFTNQKKCTTIQNKHKKLKPGSVASFHNIQPGSDRTYSCLALHKFLTELHRDLPTYLQPRDTHGAPVPTFTWVSWFTSVFCLHWLQTSGTGFYVSKH